VSIRTKYEGRRGASAGVKEGCLPLMRSNEWDVYVEHDKNSAKIESPMFTNFLAGYRFLCNVKISRSIAIFNILCLQRISNCNNASAQALYHSYLLMCMLINCKIGADSKILLQFSIRFVNIKIELYYSAFNSPCIIAFKDSLVENISQGFSVTQ
jgi:hypothetical protein